MLYAHMVSIVCHLPRKLDQVQTKLTIHRLFLHLIVTIIGVDLVKEVRFWVGYHFDLVFVVYEVARACQRDVRRQSST